MDRNSIIGIVLIAGIFIIWSVINKPSPEELKQKREADSVAWVRKQAAQQAAQEQNISKPVEDDSRGDVIQTKEDSVDYKYVTLENDVLKATFSEKGGRPVSVELKNYMRYDKEMVKLFDKDSSSFGLVYFITNQYVFTQNLHFKNMSASDSIVVQGTPERVIMRHIIDTSNYIEFQYTLAPEKYQVDLQIRFSGMENIDTRMTDMIQLSWALSSPQQEKGRDNELQYTTLYYKDKGGSVEFLNPRAKKSIQSVNDILVAEWIAYKGQFFSSVLMADALYDPDIEVEAKPEWSRFLKTFKTSVALPFKDGNVTPLSFYFGPNKYKLLKNQYGDIELHELVTVGKNIIKWINQVVIIKLFDFLSRFIGNYGIIILVMTIIIKLLLLPLTYRSYLSMAKMRVLKPQIDEINSRIPKEKAMERQQATMALYKKVGVSPMGGCLPMLLQMPILFAMFRFFPTSIELRQESFLWAEDLSTYDAIISWSANIPYISNIFGNHISLFTLLMTISTIISMKFSNQSQASSQQMPGMKSMMYVMPVMFMFILNKFSSGLTYYYFLTNIISIGQNLLFKQFIDEEEILKKLESKKSKVKPKSKFQQRLEAMAKERGYKVPKKK